MTTTTVDPAPAPTGRCIVCQRDDLPILVSRHEDSANVIAGHSAADMPDVECTGSRLPVLPANADDDTPADKIRRYATTRYLDVTARAHKERAELAASLLRPDWTTSGALDYHGLTAVRLEQEAELWLWVAYKGDWVHGISNALDVLAGRNIASSQTFKAGIEMEKQRGAREWLRAVRHHVVRAYDQTGMTSDQLAELLFKI